MFGPGGLNRRNFSKRKIENEELSSCLQNSPQQPWPLAPPTIQPLDCEHQISSPSTHLKPRSMCTQISGQTAQAQRPKTWDRCVPQSAAWAPTPEAPGGCAARSMAWLLTATTHEALGTEHLPPSPCAQSPEGPTLPLGGRQNAQQRGAAGLGETAVPRKT